MRGWEAAVGRMSPTESRMSREKTEKGGLAQGGREWSRVVSTISVTGLYTWGGRWARVAWVN